MPNAEGMCSSSIEDFRVTKCAKAEYKCLVPAAVERCKATKGCVAFALDITGEEADVRGEGEAEGEGEDEGACEVERLG